MSKNNTIIRASNSNSKLRFYIIGFCLALVLLNFSSLSTASEIGQSEFETNIRDDKKKTIAPTLEHVTSVSDQNADLFIVENTAYICQYNGSIWIFDITDPINPITLGTYQDRGGAPHGLYVENDILYCASWGSGLLLIDVSDPANPTQIGQYLDGADSCTVVVDDDIAYIGNWDAGLHIVNVSDPSHITLMSRFSDPDYLISNVVVQEKIAMITDTDLNDGDLLFVNVSDPYNPVAFSYVYQGGIACNLLVRDDLLFLCDWDAGLVILNISDYGNITVVTSITSRKMVAAANLVLVDEILYITDWEEGLFIYDISDLHNPKKIGSYSIYKASPIFVIGNYAYISSYAEGFIILDITTLGISPLFIIVPSIVGALAISGILLWKVKKK
ncbi:LVIVD repeat-containing protein [Candidatus Lokiarchaeum ossiferum]|uniref:LVIVD repeat-containing protein n=1 Tax=Candidatus Lokiarchaeum ossiferum TaxID=2951803 RepID=UPI00352C7874